MTSAVAWTTRATDDLEEIVFYIAQQGRIEVAKKLADEIRNKAQQYAHQPLMGNARPDIDQSIRVFSHKTYVVLYEPNSDGIEVLAVVHGARDFDQLFLGDECT